MRRPRLCSLSTIHLTANRWYKCMVLLPFFNASCDAKPSSWLQKALVAASCILSTVCNSLKLRLVSELHASDSVRALTLCQHRAAAR